MQRARHHRANVTHGREHQAASSVRQRSGARSRERRGPRSPQPPSALPVTVLPALGLTERDRTTAAAGTTHAVLLTGHLGADRATGFAPWPPHLA